ncbi:unnamed protein product [Plutella xylostella]|uniref:(diamondback moth) hypothetical protein n=1 Tax=Plutella xylostella TaxID=51655 RepID=A0A8S4DZJ2_PLUXY|nr:unnamed protein product [Plutella xylostella]
MLVPLERAIYKSMPLQNQGPTVSQSSKSVRRVPRVVDPRFRNQAAEKPHPQHLALPAAAAAAASRIPRARVSIWRNGGRCQSYILRP